MNGGVSQVDSFDYKPMLEKLHGQKFDPGSHFEAATSAPGAVLQESVYIRAAWPVRPLGEQRLPAHGASASMTWHS